LYRALYTLINYLLKQVVGIFLTKFTIESHTY